MLSHEVYTDPPVHHAPFMEPPIKGNPPEYVFMPFPSSIRAWASKVADGKCQTWEYDEKRGWHTCDKPVEEIDHSPPESVLLYQGKDPNNQSTPIPRCKDHHTGEGLVREDDGTVRQAMYGEPGWSKHPDAARALAEYRNGNPNAFKEMNQRHQQAIREGRRFWNSDEGVDQYERDHMEEKAVRSGIQRPTVKAHTKVEPKHWTDVFFGKNEHIEDASAPVDHTMTADEQMAMERQAEHPGQTWDDELMRWRDE